MDTITRTDYFSAKEVEKEFAARAKELSAQEETWGLSKKTVLFILLGASLANTFVLGIVDVIAVSGFVGNVGIAKLPWLWIAELSFSFFLSTMLLQIIDKLPRIKMIKILLLILTFTYFLFALAFFLNTSTKILYPLMYLIYAQQAILFPMAFWNVANQTYSLSRAKKNFPLLSSGELLGRLAGYSLFTLTGLLGHAEISARIIENPSYIMVTSGILYLMGFLLFTLFPTSKVRTSAQRNTPFLESFKKSAKLIRKVPFFKNMAFLVFSTWIALTILLYNFYDTLDTAAQQGTEFQTVYSIYNIAVLIIPLLFQWTIGDDFLEKISPKLGYFFLPITLLISVILAFIFPTFLGGIGVLFLSMIIYRGWYMPLYQSLYALVPQNQRGRVRGMLGSYSYILGSVLGAFIIGGMLFLISFLDIPPATARIFYLSTALLASILAISVAFRIRATYDESLLSWRIARRKRDSTLIKKMKFD